MENSSKGSTKNKAWAIFAVSFYAIWVLFEFYAKPFIDSAAGNEIISQIIKTVIVKNLVWTLPSMLLVRHYKEEVYIGLKEMFTTKVKWLDYLPIFVFFAVIILVPKFRAAGGLRISDEFGMKQVITYTFVGLTEEMVFRGWLLNSMIKDSDDNKRRWTCILINAVMFMMIHFPIWISDGIFVSVFTSFSFLTIIVLSIIFSLTFIKSRNILVPIALHMFWDFIMDIFA